MELAAFMGLIGLASVFVMVSLGYEGKKGGDGYISKLLKRIGGGDKTHYGHEGSSIIDKMGGIDAAEATIHDESARVGQKLDEQNAHADEINATLEKHIYGNEKHPSEDEILAELRADDGRTYDKTGGERKEVPDNLDDIMAAWEDGKDVEPVYVGHKKAHPHGA